VDSPCLTAAKVCGGVRSEKNGAVGECEFDISGGTAWALRVGPGGPNSNSFRLEVGRADGARV
jgi:hypothetical protein